MENRGKRKILTGRVVSDKMDKCVIVQYESRKLHPIYKKFVTKRKKLKARDEKEASSAGDVVRVAGCRPMSRGIRWRVVEIVTKGEAADEDALK